MKYLAIITLIVLLNLKSTCVNAVSINQIDTSKYAILNYNKEHRPIGFDKDSKSCNLSLNDIKHIEFLLNKEVTKTNKAAKKEIRNPSKFYKQFIAAINSKGEKIVWVNCFCDNREFPYWKKSVVEVLDGGPCYFQFKVNLTANTIYDFEINGVA